MKWPADIKTRPMQDNTRFLFSLLEVGCAGCGQIGYSICISCKAKMFAAWQAVSERCDVLVSPSGRCYLPVWARFNYCDELRNAILAWKSGSRPDLNQLWTQIVISGLWGLAQSGAVDLARPLYLVPAACGWRRRLSANNVVGNLAYLVARQCRKQGWPVNSCDILRRPFMSKNAHLLGKKERQRTRAALLRLTKKLAAGTQVILLDDVCTTGATLNQSRKTIENAGLKICGALVLASTPKGD